MVDETAEDEQNPEDRQQSWTAEGDDGSGKTFGEKKATRKMTDKKIGGNED